MINSTQYTLIEKNVVDPDKQSIYDALRPVKWFEPTILSCAGMIGLTNHPHEPVIAMTFSDYKQQKQNNTLPKGVNRFFIIKKQDIQSSYLYNYEKKIINDNDLDESDKSFLSSVSDTTLLEKHTFYGLHTYDGHWGFFRPELEEVINLIHPWWSALSVKPSIVYITTEPHPSHDLSESYDKKSDRHRAVTTIWIPLTHSSNQPKENVQ